MVQPGEAASIEISQLERLSQQLQTLSPEARVTVTLVVMQQRALAEAADWWRSGGCVEVDR